MSLQFGSNPFYQERLNETRLRKPAPPLLDKLATPQKNTLCSFHFARAGFLFLLMKRVFFCGVLPSKYSGRWWDWPHFDLAREKRNSSPHPPSMRESHLGFSCIRMQRRKSAFHSQPLSARAVSVHDSGGIAPVSSCARL